MSVIPCIYIFLQIVLLFLLRKVFLMTVYQTVAAYGAVCLAGLGLMALSDKSPRRPYGLAVLRDQLPDFLERTSNGVIVLGILTMGSYYLTLTQITLVQIVNIFLQVGMWATPILWNISLLDGEPLLQGIIRCNPLFYVVNGYRNAMFADTWFWQDSMGAMTVYFWVVTAVLFAVGTLIFRRLKVHFADVL